jgi:hypothetical protein
LNNEDIRLSELYYQLHNGNPAQIYIYIKHQPEFLKVFNTAIQTKEQRHKQEALTQEEIKTLNDEGLNINIKKDVTNNINLNQNYKVNNNDEKKHNNKTSQEEGTKKKELSFIKEMIIIVIKCAIKAYIKHKIEEYIKKEFNNLSEEQQNEKIKDETIKSDAFVNGIMKSISEALTNNTLLGSGAAGLKEGIASIVTDKLTDYKNNDLKSDSSILKKIFNKSGIENQQLVDNITNTAIASLGSIIRDGKKDIVENITTHIVKSTAVHQKDKVIDNNNINKTISDSLTHLLVDTIKSFGKSSLKEGFKKGIVSASQTIAKGIPDIIVEIKNNKNSIFLEKPASEQYINNDIDEKTIDEFLNEIKKDNLKLQENNNNIIDNLAPMPDNKKINIDYSIINNHIKMINNNNKATEENQYTKAKKMRANFEKNTKNTTNIKDLSISELSTKTQEKENIINDTIQSKEDNITEKTTNIKDLSISELNDAINKLNDNIKHTTNTAQKSAYNNERTQYKKEMESRPEYILENLNKIQEEKILKDEIKGVQNTHGDKILNTLDDYIKQAPPALQNKYQRIGNAIQEVIKENILDKEIGTSFIAQLENKRNNPSINSAPNLY